MAEVVIVTGAAGFLGSHLSSYYLKKNCQVIGIDNFLSGSPKNIHDLQMDSNFHFIRHSVEDDWSALEQFLELKKIKQIKYLFHFASVAEPAKFQSHYPEIMKANSIGTINALDFARKYKARLIYASSSEIYGNLSTLPLSESEFGHVNSIGFRSCYNEAKRFSESFITHTNRTYGNFHGIVRIFNTYGPRINPQDTRAIVSMINWSLRHKDVQIYGDDERTRSFCYVDDLIKGITAYADSKLTQPMNLGSDNEISILDLAKKIIKLSRSKSAIVFKEARLDEVKKRKPSLEFARKELQYKTVTTLDEGLLKTIEYLKQNAQTRFHTSGNQSKINDSQGRDKIG